MWRTKMPDLEQVKRLQTVRQKHDLTPMAVHGSYLVNLASNDPIIREKSIDCFRGEIERAVTVGAEYLVTHPGNYKGMSREEGLVNVANGLALAWRAVDEQFKKKSELQILLENTAGAGAQLGGELTDLSTIRELVTPSVDIPVAYCLDTCHCFVWGFDLSRKAGFRELMEVVEETLSWSRVPVIHTNDAKMQLGSHLDRHANIGSGYIGSEGFRRILNHPKLREKAFILETPVDEPGDDLRNITALKELISPSERSTTKKSSRNGTSSGRRTKVFM